LRALIQRVERAQVRVEGRVVGAIEVGLLVFLGVAQGDGRPEADWIARKILGLRAFGGDGGGFDLDLEAVDGALLVVSQFTLYGDTRRGRRPDFGSAAGPEDAEPLYDYLVERLRASGRPVETGIFGAMMAVELVNDGPVTLILER
jgi:D-tyrosyl-tRNA(Tyr) deacylase